MIKKFEKENFLIFQHTYENQLLDYGRAIGTNQCLYQHKAELNTKTAVQLVC